MIVHLTQLVRPNGLRRPVEAEVPDELKPMVDAILAKGYRFTAEVLGEPFGVSLCIEDDEEDKDIEIASNGPGDNAPPAALERMIRRFYGRINGHK
jgi:hypothetical protein